MHSDNQQQKDFISSMFSQDSANDSIPNTQDYYAAFPGPQAGMEGMMSMSAQNISMVNGQGTRQFLLEQQLKIQQLQQLQQLQQQIFQQQMELLSGGQGTGSVDPRAAQHLHGLPTPVSSTELRAQPNAEYVSPMMLQHPGTSYPSNPINSHQTSPRFTHHDSHLHLSNSAPANIAFHMSPLPTDMDFDISPLTSPWLEAYPQQQAASSSSNKRTASPSDGESNEKPSRKRKNPAAVASRKSTRGSKSASSTPAFRPSGFRKDKSGEGVVQSPSPVDLSMPPPGHPGPATESSIVFDSCTPTGTGERDLTPVTPASIMNLGRLGVNSSLVPPQPKANEGRAKNNVKIKTSSDTSSFPASSNLKLILPAEGSSNTQQPSQPIIPMKKSSHKDAEQKRRDSLKTSFDDLRLLLPPIPLPSDDTYSGEPRLPGAMPPRGPPRQGGGPNMNVSKLQLLRCGNDYIRILKGRIDRRNEEIEALRQEVRRLRNITGPADLQDDKLDLERDLDFMERASMTSVITEADEDDVG